MTQAPVVADPAWQAKLQAVHLGQVGTPAHVDAAVQRFQIVLLGHAAGDITGNKRGEYTSFLAQAVMQAGQQGNNPPILPGNVELAVLMQIQQSLGQMQLSQARTEVMVRNSEARWKNSHATGGDNALVGLVVFNPNAVLQQPAVPANFPQTWRELMDLPGPQATALLNYYGLVLPHLVVDMRTRLGALLVYSQESKRMLSKPRGPFACVRSL